MAKIVLGKRPESFTSPVTTKLLDGSDGVVEWEYIYRAKTEFGEFIDSLAAEAGVEIAPAAEAGQVKFLLADFMGKQVGKSADYIMKIARGWNLEVPFTLESVRQLCDELPAAATDCVETYRVACMEGRAKN